MDTHYTNICDGTERDIPMIDLSFRMKTLIKVFEFKTFPNSIWINIKFIWEYNKVTHSFLNILIKKRGRRGRKVSTMGRNV